MVGERIRADLLYIQTSGFRLEGHRLKCGFPTVDNFVSKSRIFYVFTINLLQPRAILYKNALFSDLFLFLVLNLDKKVTLYGQ